MISFDQVMEFTRTVSGQAAFEDAECRAYYDILAALPEGATVVEVGLQFGRSSSIVAQVSLEKHFNYIGIDPFTQPQSALPVWVEMVRKIGVPFTLHCMRTDQVYPLPSPDVVLIDGDHHAPGVRTDCDAFVTRAKRYMLFHDYGVESLPGVYPTVNACLKEHGGWEELQTAGTLGIWRRLP